MTVRHLAAVDVHAHTLVPEVEALVRQQEGWRREVAERNVTVGARSLEYNRQRFEDTYKQRFASIETRLADMDAMEIGLQLVSTTPSFSYNYWADRALAPRIVTMTNEGIAAFCAQRPDRFAGLGTVSLQHPDLVAAQLEQAMGEFGLKGVIVSTSVGGVDLADPRFEPFWTAAERLGAVVFIHPIGCAMEMRLASYYLSNVMGNPLETALALTHLIFSGTLDRHPGLKLLAAHGGGFLPFYSGRFDHGWRVRPEAHTAQLPPSEYLRKIWFDSLVFSPEILGFLIRQVGPGQVMLGTDYPMDMGTDRPLELLRRVAGLSANEVAAIAGENARRLLGLQ
jgi:aminocarboxymuconate-semialdehyde decarboxylase